MFQHQQTNPLLFISMFSTPLFELCRTVCDKCYTSRVASTQQQFASEVGPPSNIRLTHTIQQTDSIITVGVNIGALVNVSVVSSPEG